MKKLINSQLFKFLLVGVLNTALGAFIMFSLYNFFGFTYWFSSACNYITGGIVSFILNRKFTFNSPKQAKKEILPFILSLAICYILAYGLAKPIIFNILQGGSISFKENLSMVLGMVLYTALNFLLQKFFVFKRK